jgi:hypothetical protein
VKSVGGAIHLRLPENVERHVTHRVGRLLGASVSWKSEQPYTRKQGPGSGNQLLHREIFDRVGVYDLDYQLRGYDVDLYRRIREAGFESWFTPHAIGHHLIPHERLTEEYLFQTSLHNGWTFACRDLAEQGINRAVSISLARVGHMCLFSIPALLLAKIRCNEEETLSARCRLRHAEGYLRCVLFKIAPRLCAQKGFFTKHEFRAERKMMATS